MYLRDDNSATVQWKFKHKGSNYEYFNFNFELDGENISVTISGHKHLPKQHIVINNYKCKTAVEIINEQFKYMGNELQSDLLVVYHDLNLPLGYNKHYLKDFGEVQSNE